MMTTTRIELYVYDLSHGLASTLGQQLTGKQIDGIWHTALVLFDMEIFYGQGVSIISPPGTTHHGQPNRILDMGTTQLDRNTFLEYIQGIKETYQADRYHLLDFNCNSFTNDVLGFLNGNSIPAYISDLPREIMSTPFGQSMRPMIDQMFSGRSGPSATTAVSSLSTIAATTASSTSNGNANDKAEAKSSLSNLSLSSSPESLRSILNNNKGVAVMFSSLSCQPCTIAKPIFEALAVQFPKLQFVIVELSVGRAGEMAKSTEFGGPITVTPSFSCWVEGKQVSDLTGGEERELRSQIGMLNVEAFPPHPHTKLSLPLLTKLSRSLAPVVYTTVPPFPALITKITSSFDCLSMTAEDGEKGQIETLKRILIGQVIPFLSTLSASTSTSSSSATTSTVLPSTLLTNWITSTRSALHLLPPSDWFPFLDLWRIALFLSPAQFASPFGYSIDDNSPSLMDTILLGLEATPTPALSKALSLTAIKLFSNALVSPVLVTLVLEDSERRGRLTQWGIRSVTEGEKTVRASSAGLMWSLTCAVRKRATGTEPIKVEEDQEEEWEVEMMSAIVEGIRREEESVDVVHRLLATLGLLLLKWPHYQSLVALLEVLGVRDILENNRVRLCKGSKDVVGLIAELVALLNVV